MGSEMCIRDRRKSNVEAFCHRLSLVDWSVIYEYSSVQECVEFFYSKFEEVMSVIPVSFVKLGPKTKPWITPVLLDLINKRWRAFREKNFLLFAHYKVKVKKELIKSKRIWSEKVSKTAKGVWSIVNDIRNKNERESSCKIVSLYPTIDIAAESLNNMFASFFVKSPSVPMFQTTDLSTMIFVIIILY